MPVHPRKPVKARRRRGSTRAVRRRGRGTGRGGLARGRVSRGGGFAKKTGGTVSTGLARTGTSNIVVTRPQPRRRPKPMRVRGGRVRRGARRMKPMTMESM